jgi:hypothetical protein
MNPISDSAPTADEALQRLKAGNERFILADLAKASIPMPRSSVAATRFAPQRRKRAVWSSTLASFASL